MAKPTDLKKILAYLLQCLRISMKKKVIPFTFADGFKNKFGYFLNRPREVVHEYKIQKPEEKIVN